MSYKLKVLFSYLCEFQERFHFFLKALLPSQSHVKQLQMHFSQVSFTVGQPWDFARSLAIIV
jgi:hypothetical protein